MKILFVATVDLHIKTFHLRTIHQLVSRGDLVDVVTNGDYTNDDIHQKFTVPFSRNPFSLGNVKAKKEIRKIVQEGKYDIVSCHTPLASYFTRMALKDVDVKVIYTAHGFHFWKGCPIQNRLIYKTMEKRAAKYTDVLVTINPEDYNAAKEFTYKPNGGPVFIPGVGVDVKKIRKQKTDKQEIFKELNLPDDAFVVFTIGELIPRKNHLFVMKALEDQLKNNPKLYFVICGNGKLTDYYTNYIKEKGLEDKILLLGFRKDARKLLYGADLFVFSSKHEGLPVAVMEAMSVGLPIIASDVRGSRDLIHDGENGFLFEYDNVDEFRNKFHTLYENESLRNELASRVKKDIEPYSIEEVDPLIMNLYKL